MKEMTCEAIVANIKPVTDFVNAELRARNCPSGVRVQIDIAIDELFGNIARYAYETSVGDATVGVGWEERPPTVVITFTDQGMPFNLLEAHDPDVTLSAYEREVGGLGVYLVKKTMDKVSYEYRDGHNVVCIRKRIE